MKNLLQFSYDSEKDWMTIEGITYTGDFFRAFKEPNPKSIYKFRKDEFGALSVIEFKADFDASDPSWDY